MIGPVNILLIIIFLIVVPFTLGLMAERLFDDSEQGILLFRPFIMGFALMLASFQIVAVPMIIKNCTFSQLFYVYGTVVIIMTVFAMTMYVRNGGKKIHESVTCVKGILEKLNREEIIIAVFALAIILFQVILLVVFTHVDTDDSRFIVEAIDAVENNTLLRIHPITGEYIGIPKGEMVKDIFSPYPLYIAVMSQLTRMNPTVFAHTVLPPFLIIASYIVIGMIGECLLSNKTRLIRFMLLFSVCVLFSFESVYSWGYTLLTIIWQGRSVVATVMLPMMLYMLMKCVEENINIKHYVSLIIIVLANADLSGMGSIMSFILGGVFSLTVLVQKKKIKESLIIFVCSLVGLIFSLLFKFVSKGIIKL